MATATHCNLKSPRQAPRPETSSDTAANDSAYSSVQSTALFADCNSVITLKRVIKSPRKCNKIWTNSRISNLEHHHLTKFGLNTGSKWVRGEQVKVFVSFYGANNRTSRCADISAPIAMRVLDFRSVASFRHCGASKSSWGHILNVFTSPKFMGGMGEIS